MTRPAPTADKQEASPGRQRLDKWLWFARVTKSRSLAARLVEDGHVRVNSVRADSPAKAIKPGDVLTVALDRAVRILQVAAPGERRGPYPEARRLYVDLGEPAPETGGDNPQENDA